MADSGSGGGDRAEERVVVRERVRVRERVVV